MSCFSRLCFNDQDELNFELRNNHRTNQTRNEKINNFKQSKGKLNTRKPAPEKNYTNQNPNRNFEDNDSEGQGNNYPLFNNFQIQGGYNQNDISYMNYLNNLNNINTMNNLNMSNYNTNNTVGGMNNTNHGINNLNNSVLNQNQIKEYLNYLQVKNHDDKINIYTKPDSSSSVNTSKFYIKLSDLKNPNTINKLDKNNIEIVKSKSKQKPKTKVKRESQYDNYKILQEAEDNSSSSQKNDKDSNSSSNFIDFDDFNKEISSYKQESVNFKKKKKKESENTFTTQKESEVTITEKSVKKSKLKEKEREKVKVKDKSKDKEKEKEKSKIKSSPKKVAKKKEKQQQETTLTNDAKSTILNDITTTYKDPFSCHMCENIYKNSIFYSAPIKSSFKCSYCNNFLNENSLKFYEMKYQSIQNSMLMNNINQSYLMNMGNFNSIEVPMVNNNNKYAYIIDPNISQSFQQNYKNQTHQNAYGKILSVNQTFNELNIEEVKRKKNESSLGPNNKEPSIISTERVISLKVLPDKKYRQMSNQNFSNQQNDTTEVDYYESYSKHEKSENKNDSKYYSIENEKPYNKNKKDDFDRKRYEKLDQHNRVKKHSKKKKPSWDEFDDCLDVNYESKKIPQIDNNYSEMSIDFEDDILSNIKKKEHKEESYSIEEKKLNKDECLMVFTNDNYIKNGKKVPKKEKKDILKEIKSNNEEEEIINQSKKKESILVGDNDNPNQPSLAELFKKKKKILIDKIETREIDEEQLKEKYKVKLNTKPIQSKEEERSTSAQPIIKKYEPPAELVERLRKGGKVEVFF